MTQRRVGQRGVTNVATSVIVAGFGLVAATTGCSSDESYGRGGGERLGTVVHALQCKGEPLPCPADTACATWSCSAIGFKCQATFAKNGTFCGGTKLDPMICTDGVCCGGCVRPSKLGPGTCHPGTALDNCGSPGEHCSNCNLGDTCTAYSCDAGRCGASPVPDNGACTDDSGACLAGRCCTGCTDNGECVPGGTTSQCGISTAAGGLVKCLDCEDGSVCTGDPCTNGVCAAKTPQAGTCDDATVCNGHETCGGLTCNNGPAPNCNDGKVCTIDSCDAQDGCANTPKEGGTPCDDGNICNGVSKCDGGTECKPGTPLDCDDSNPCTTDSCDPATGCKNVNNTADCSDNNLCTLVDKCSGGTCVGTGAPNCDDNEPCTTDTCHPTLQCRHMPVTNGTSCDDENGCTTSSECAAGKCQGTGGLNCDDGDPCTKPTCTLQAGCTQPNEDNGTPCTFDKCHVNSTCQAGECAAGTLINCDDSNPCTTDSCDALTGCKHVNVDGGDCSDDNQCTSADKCAGGACVGTPKVCAPLDDCHVAGSCDVANGACTDPRAPEGTDCQTVASEDGECSDLGVCVPTPGAGGAGAGGEPGAGGAGTGGTMVGEGGEPPMMPIGGEGNEPGGGGMPGEAGGGGSSPMGGSAGTGASSSAGDGTGEDPDEEESAFVRQPGGCSCTVPGSNDTSGGSGWLTGLALLLGFSRRRRERGQQGRAG